MHVKYNITYPTDITNSKIIVTLLYKQASITNTIPYTIVAIRVSGINLLESPEHSSFLEPLAAKN